MKTFYAHDIKVQAEDVSKALGVPVTIGPRQMYGNENNYTLFIDGTQVPFGRIGSGSTDAIGGFLSALQFLDIEVVADVFYREEATLEDRLNANLDAVGDAIKSFANREEPGVTDGLTKNEYQREASGRA